MAESSPPSSSSAITGPMEKPVDASGWRRFASALGAAARATGRGLATATRVTVENRHYVLPVLNGFVGDQLARAADGEATNLVAPGLGGAIQMSFREDGRDVSIADLGLADRLRGPGRTVVVTVHGLMEDEVLFQDSRWQSTAPTRPGHATCVVRKLGATALHLRYNSGLHISQNGQRLSTLLEDLMEAHGEDIHRLVLLCHSMGGLVARSAGHYGQRQGRTWVERLSDVVLIAVPMRGSFVEQFANLTAYVLNRVGNLYTRIGGWVIDERSDGIKDLRFGLMVDEDWQEHPYDDRLWMRKTAIPPLPGVRYHVIAGAWPKDEGSVLTLAFGDGLVGRKSGTGDVLFSPDDPDHPCGTVRFFPGHGHFQLLTNPEIGDYVAELLTG